MNPPITTPTAWEESEPPEPDTRPRELIELGDLFDKAYRDIAGALAIERDLDDPKQAGRFMLEAMSELVVSLREWVDEHASRDAPGITLEAADELRRLVYGAHPSPGSAEDRAT